MDQRLDRAEFVRVFGQQTYDRVVENAGNEVFRALNITTWTGLAWVALGFLGQGAFFGRIGEEISLMLSYSVGRHG
jgi:hypothetical protein